MIFLRVLLTLAILTCGAQAQSPVLPGPGLPVAASGCSEATTFLARTSGLNGTETSAYTTMICGMVTDGVWAKLDALYIFATNTTTTANLNLISTSYTASQVGASLSFSADNGYTPGNGLSGLDTGFVPSTAPSPKFTLNSGFIAVYVLNNRTTNAATYAIGTQVTGGDPSFLSLLNSGATFYDINDANFPSVAATTSRGNWAANRTASNAIALYRNGSSIGSDTGSSSALSSVSFYIMGRNQNGTFSGGSNGDQFAAAAIGGGLSAGDVTNFQSRLNAYMTALGINVH